MGVYKNIEFAKGYNRPFADFIKEFGKAKVFRDMQPDIREKELDKAWKIACKGNSINDIEVEEAKEIKSNGDIISTVRKSKKTKSRKDS